MNTANFNNAIEAQAIALEVEIKQRGQQYGIRHRSNSPSNSESLRKIKMRTGQKEGTINRVGYTFPRTLIYTHTGSGKGQGGIKGSRWQNRYGENMRTNPRSMGKAGTGNRKEKPFIDEALKSEQGVPKISEIAAVELGASISGNLFIDKNNIGKP